MGPVVPTLELFMRATRFKVKGSVNFTGKVDGHGPWALGLDCITGFSQLAKGSLRPPKIVSGQATWDPGLTVYGRFWLHLAKGNPEIL